MFRPDPKPIPVKKKKIYRLSRTPIKKKYKKTGELEIFKELIQEREMKCENCKVDIIEPTVTNFSHRKSKGSHPEMRLDKSNIQILCAPCHYAYDCQGMEAYNKRKK